MYSYIGKIEQKLFNEINLEQIPLPRGYDYPSSHDGYITVVFVPGSPLRSTKDGKLE